MSVIAMLVCESAEHDTQDSSKGTVHLRAMTDIEGEYKQFFAYTPYADLRMGILNDAAFSQIKPGKTYRMTLEQVD